MTWATKWLGRPFLEQGRGPKGYDCWGLVAAALRAERGVEIDMFADVNTWDSPRVAEIVRAQIERDDWIPVDIGEVRDFDVALMWMHRKLFGKHTVKALTHIGLVIAPAQVLHVEPEIFSSAPRFSHESVRERLHSFYRHRRLA